MAESTAQQNRKNRLAQQLRANLQRRKAQARERSQEDSQHQTTANNKETIENS